MLTKKAERKAEAKADAENVQQAVEASLNVFSIFVFLLVKCRIQIFSKAMRNLAKNIKCISTDVLFFADEICFI